MMDFNSNKHMKNTVKIILVLFFALILSKSIYAEKYKGNIGGGKTIQNISAGCMPPKGLTELNINNVRCRINTGGDMWWDLSGNAKYYIPYNTTKTSMFSGSLWIGGVDINGQLKVAALRYRQVGYDYWPGPLTIDGTAAVDPITCVKYDKHFVIYRADVDNFIAWRSDGTYKTDNADAYNAILKKFKEYPAHPYTDVPLSNLMSNYLAPFKDVNNDGSYDPEQGDYPYYDITNELCKTQTTTMEGNGILVDQVLKGDQTVWWVFNDKGNAHTESKGQPIGFEIRAQAFAFSTNDEVNNMTFYSYEIINRSTYELTGTYFSQWVDTDLGFADDDYVGCDVLRGLGYCYNGKEIDGAGQPQAYGTQPPAVGVDFFQGPYMDPDGKDNPKYNKITHENCNEAINGVNFGDGIIDNERFGMRRFVYHNNQGPFWQNDPAIAIDYYNLLRGIWKDGKKMTYGGDGHGGNGGTEIPADFMFPGTTDPCGWGTGGVMMNPWTEYTFVNTPNPPADRRFMHSAGPFILKSGAVNYITVGIPWARASSGGAWASVEALKQADDKCQILFDNCFKVIDGPTAPDLTIQELDNEILVFISNKKGASNNYVNKPEDYEEFDPSIITPDPLLNLIPPVRYDSTYNFQGYQIYQLKDANVTANDLEDPDKARLVFQCDLKDNIKDLVNFEEDANTGFLSSKKKVNGAKNAGIVHSFRILNDKFATGNNTRLINHKQYYFMAVAYGYNEFLKYSQDPNVNYIFDTIIISGLSGQKKPYLSGRKNLKVYTGIPHNPIVEGGGTVIQAYYGYGPKITRLDGQGNGGQILELTQNSINQIMSGPPYRMENPEYENNNGPVNVKVIDPLGVKPGNFIIKFKNTSYKPKGTGSTFEANDTTRIINADWELIHTDINKVIPSEISIKIANEQLLLDYGLSITISQPYYPGQDSNTVNNGFLGASIEYADSLKPWLDGVGDVDFLSPMNWIRTGNESAGLDPNGLFGKMIPISSFVPGGATWAPYKLTTGEKYGPANGPYLPLNRIEYLQSVDLVFTNDKSKWTRCPVIEICEEIPLAEGGAKKFALRKGKSLDINGNIENPDSTGMSWFPGYAINVETGERLNIIFSENSWLVGDNGRDMKFNPTSNFMTDPPTDQVLWGGQHYVYIVGHFGDGPNDCPAYDEGVWLKSKLSSSSASVSRNAFTSIMYVGMPMASKNFTWMNCDATLKFRVERLYKKFIWGNTKGTYTPQNNYAPMFSFNTFDIQTIYNDNTTAKSALDLINVVPNPYYAYSGYEKNQLDNRIKFVNLPVKCTISIYTVNGTLIRKLTKDSDVSFFDWDLKNSAGIPVAGGVYIIHIDAGDIGEKVIKWFGIMRPVDLNAF
jgi:hypothetical protein